MASSAVSSALDVHNEVGNQAEISTGACIYYGDAASFHEREFRTRPHIACKTFDQYIEAMSKVCDGLRGDAFVAAQEVGLDNLCEIIDGRQSGINKLISHMREMALPFTEHESKELFHQYCRPGGPLSRQSGESMKQYVSRRRRCWTLLTRMDPVMHLSGGHRSDMLLDLSGLTREERVMVQASINKERDFDQLADALIIQRPRIHLRESRKSTKAKGKDGMKSNDTINIRRLSRTKTQTPETENWEQVLVTQTSLLLKITVTTTAKLKQQMRIKHITIQLTLEAKAAKKPCTARTVRNMTCFLHLLPWMTLLFSRQLNLMRLLFSLTHGTMILTQKLAHSWCKQMYELTFPSERRKVRAEVRASFLFAHHVCH